MACVDECPCWLSLLVRTVSLTLCLASQHRDRAHAFDLQDPWNGNTGTCATEPTTAFPGYDCSTPWFMGPGIHPRFKRPVGHRLALGALHAAYRAGDGVRGGSILGCSLQGSKLTLSFQITGARKLSVRPYNRSNVGLSATSVRDGASGQWVPVHIQSGPSPGTVVVELGSSGLSAGTLPTAVRYAWGGTGGGSSPTPNGDDISCCEGDGVEQPCLPAQCPLLVPEPLAPFGVLPVDPFIAEIQGGKCVCPEPQMCGQ